MDCFSQNLHATHTNLAKSSGGPYVAAELRGDGPAEEHRATGTEATEVVAPMAAHRKNKNEGVKYVLTLCLLLCVPT